MPLMLKIYSDPAAEINFLGLGLNLGLVSTGASQDVYKVKMVKTGAVSDKPVKRTGKNSGQKAYWQKKP